MERREFYILKETIYNPELKSTIDKKLEERYSQYGGTIVLHTRPLMWGRLGFSQVSPKNCIQVVSVGWGEGVYSLGKGEGSSPDLPFDEESLDILQQFLQQTSKPLVIAPYIKYAPEHWLNKANAIMNKAGADVVAIDPKQLEEIEGKRNFHKILESAGYSLGYTLLSYNSWDEFIRNGGWDSVRGVFGETFVVQSNDSAGGSGTCLVGIQHTLKEAEEMVRSHGGWFKVVPYIEGYETNGSAVVLKDGTVLIDPLSHKPVSDTVRETIGGKKAGAVGDDWTRAWSPEVQSAYKDLMTKVGGYLHKEYRYRGLFGIDIIVGRDGKIYPHEINARPQGTTIHHAIRANVLGRPSSWDLHLLTLLGEDVRKILGEEAISLWNDIVAEEVGGWQFDIVPRPNEVGATVRRDINGRWSFNFEDKELVENPNGPIIICAPKPGHVLDWYDPNGNKRLTAHGQIYCVPLEGYPEPALPIFDYYQQEPTEFGKLLAEAVRKLLL